MAERHEVERIRRAVDSLPSPGREVYCLSAIDGLEHAAIGALVGLTTAEVETALAEAIVTLDRLLAEEGK